MNVEAIKKTYHHSVSRVAGQVKRRFSLSRKSIALERALEETMNWMLRAQDATPDAGVAQAYFIQGKCWTASYPETTGYIIPTFFDYAKLTNNREFFERALAMTEWAAEIQLQNGAIQASTIDVHDVAPTIFNTGMVIFGWLRAYEETEKHNYLESARKAADWLVSVQDQDGPWLRFGSTVTVQSVNTYNTRVAWALLEVHRVTNECKYLEAARNNLQWAILQQIPNGWLRNNCLLDNNQPYTHTIAYAMRGFLEAAAYLEDERYLNAARLIFAGLQPHIKWDGFLSARFDKHWQPTTSYCCLTGNAQLAINAYRLFELTSEDRYIEKARTLLQFVLRTQETRSADENIRGGIAGSFPQDGKYHPYQYPNWAAKFTADAIMKLLELERKENGK